MLKTFTIAAIAFATAAAIRPLHAHEVLGIALNGPDLTGLSGQIGPRAPDEEGMRVIALRRPTAAK